MADVEVPVRLRRKSGHDFTAVLTGLYVFLYDRADEMRRRYGSLVIPCAVAHSGVTPLTVPNLSRISIALIGYFTTSVGGNRRCCFTTPD
jgi:hypothetical protein